MTLEKLTDLEPRLTNRYHQLVLEYMNSGEPLSAELKEFLNKISSFARPQATCRFYKNEAISFHILQNSLTTAGHKGLILIENRMPYAFMIRRT